MTRGECEPVTDRQATILGGWQNISCSTLMTMTGILDQMILGKLFNKMSVKRSKIEVPYSAWPIIPFKTLLYLAINYLN